MAQELSAHGFDSIYYYNSKKRGEVDFMVETDGAVLPIEVKSGKDFKAHAALDNLLKADGFGISAAWVVGKSEKIGTTANCRKRVPHGIRFLQS